MSSILGQPVAILPPHQFVTHKRLIFLTIIIHYLLRCEALPKIIDQKNTGNTITSQEPLSHTLSPKFSTSNSSTPIPIATSNSDHYGKNNTNAITDGGVNLPINLTTSFANDTSKNLSQNGPDSSMDIETTTQLFPQFSTEFNNDQPPIGVDGNSVEEYSVENSDTVQTIQNVRVINRDQLLSEFIQIVAKPGSQVIFNDIHSADGGPIIINVEDKYVQPTAPPPLPIPNPLFTML